MLAIITRMTLTQVGFRDYLSLQRSLVIFAPAFIQQFILTMDFVFGFNHHFSVIQSCPRILVQRFADIQDLKLRPDREFFSHSGLHLVCKCTKEAEKRKQGDVVASRLQKLRRPSLRWRRRHRRGGEATQI